MNTDPNISSANLSLCSLFSLYTDRTHAGAANDDDDEVPRISLQEMLEDLTLEDSDPVSQDPVPQDPVPQDTDGAEMMSEWQVIYF